MSQIIPISVHQGLQPGDDPGRAEPVDVLLGGAAAEAAPRRSRPGQAGKVPQRPRLSGEERTWHVGIYAIYVKLSLPE